MNKLIFGIVSFLSMVSFSQNVTVNINGGVDYVLNDDAKGNGGLNFKYEQPDLILGANYNYVDNFEAFIKGEKNINNLNISGKLEYDLTDNDSYTVKIGHILEPIKDKFEDGGSLYGELNIDYSRYSSKIYANLANMKKGIFKLGAENAAKYKDVTIEVNYDLDIAKNIFVEHRPGIRVDYVGKIGNLEFKTENKDYIKINHLKNKIHNIGNLLKTDNNLKYSKDFYNIDLRVINILDSDELNNTYHEEAINSFATSLGYGIKYKGLEHSLNLGYRLDGLDVRYIYNINKNNIDHDIFVWSKNKYSYDVNKNLGLEVNADVFSLSKVNIETDAFVDANINLSYNKDDIKIKQKLGTGVKIPTKDFIIESKTEVDYLISPSIKLESGLDFDFRTKYLKNEYLGFKKMVENLGLVDDKFYDDHILYFRATKIGNESIIESMENEISELGGYHDSIYFTMNPKIALNMKFISNSLLVRPSLESKIVFSGDKNKFNYKKLGVKGNLKLEYLW
ncbi:hypothetical protein [Streptobacillus canis]|uniref:hypothetical protein n=1 Tax=Streptobacillus canis TaxID=2678686 RepID=UPI0012E1C1D2|nr:hypothetical protein [Streptobacillus canis]